LPALGEIFVELTLSERVALAMHFTRQHTRRGGTGSTLDGLLQAHVRFVAS
jgi:hypothetical protein